MKLYLFAYAGYGGEMVMVKARDVVSANKKMNAFINAQIPYAPNFEEPKEIMFDANNIAELGYFGE